MFTSLRRTYTRSARLRLGFCLFVVGTSIASVYSDKALTLLWAEMAILVPLTVIELIISVIMTRRSQAKLNIQISAIERAIDEGRPFTLADLPPGMQEDIQITWAKKILSEKKN